MNPEDWDTIENVPLYEPVLMAVKDQIDGWRYGVGSVVEFKGTRLEANWNWAMPPTHYQRLTPPAAEQTLDRLRETKPRLICQACWQPTHFRIGVIKENGETIRVCAKCMNLNQDER